MTSFIKLTFKNSFETLYLDSYLIQAVESGTELVGSESAPKEETFSRIMVQLCSSKPTVFEVKEPVEEVMRLIKESSNF